MSKSRRVWIFVTIIFIAIIFGSFVFGKRAFSYDTNIAHPNIVTIAALEYNKMYDSDLTLEEIGWLTDGAVEEDMPTRWLNHFYDPVYNKGLNNGEYPTAKDWSRMTNYQTTFALGDQTWYRAIDYWKKGDKKKALKALGHILHLIADMSVPAHTRDDPHPTGDSYEQFVKNNWDKIAQYSANAEKKQINSLDEVFDIVANFSNNNFYSDDTILLQKYSEPVIKKYIDVETVDGFEAYGVSNSGVKLFVKSSDKKGWDVLIGVKKENKKIIPHLNTIVLTDYSKNLLSPAASYTIATIDLFFKEAEKEQNVKLAKYKNSLIGAADYLLGTVIKKAEGLYNLFKGKDDGTAVASEGTQINGTNSTPIMSVTASDFDNLPIATTQNTINKTQASEASEVIVEDVENASPAVNPEDSTAGVESVEYVEKKPVKVEKSKEVVIAPSPAPAVQEQVWYLGGSGGGGTANTPPTPLREGSLPVVESPIVDGSLTVPSSEEGAGGVGGGTTTTIETTQDADLSTGALADVDSATQVTTSTTLDITQNSINITRVATSTESVTTTLDVSITTSTEQIATTTLDVVITTSTISATSTPAVEAFGLTAGQASSTFTPLVVINEIAWAGTASNKANDEWIELYSNATSTIDLTGWKILVGDKEIKLSGAIFAGDYYLLERTKDKTVTDITADLVFTLVNGLNNDGARLKVINSAGETIDEVDASSGWFAGDKIKYRSMARKSVVASGNDPSNWFSSQGLPAKGKADGGAVIYGSPKFSNYGYWLLKVPMSYYSDLLDADKTLTLTKANSPYVIDYSTQIPVGYTLKIEQGVVLFGIDKTSHFSVAGNLVVEGAVDAPVIFTSALDTNYVQANPTSLTGSASPGDWSRIQVEPGGNFTGGFVKFLYGGQTFKKSMGAMAATYFHSNVIYNNGGAVNLDNVEFSSSFFDSSPDNEQYSAIIYVEAPNGYDASLTVKNSNFNGGWRAIKNFRQGNGQTITTSLTGNTFQNFQNSDQLIKSTRDFVSLADSVFSNNASDNVQIDSWTMARDYTLDTATQYLFNSISVPEGVTLIIDPGVKIKLAKYGAVEVDGSIQANGTVEQPIIVETQVQGDKWGYIKLNNSNSTFNYTNFIGGDLTVNMDPKTRAALMLENSTVNLNNVNILDSRAPGNAIYSLNSNLNINNSFIGHTEEPDFDTTGIKAKGGSIILDNVILQNLEFGIRGDFDDSGVLPHLELNNMTEENFVNVVRPWEPNTWLSPTIEE